MRTVSAPPIASALIESMRDLGYSLETAVADVIDNSITAGARTIDLMVPPEESNPIIGILDDGIGMTEAELFAAMRPGSQNPLEDRPETDLGRFGLGLKTASFSQCRRVTVVTRKDGSTSAATWDLDYVKRTNDWLIQVPESYEAIPWAEQLGTSGTLVVWEKLDRSLDGSSSAHADLTRRIDETSEHLELVFHRYLAGERSLQKIRIRLNNRVLEPFDPFHSRHPATIIGHSEIIKTSEQDITIKAYTLPHHGKVSTRDWTKFAGRAGYVKNQGFYVYRAKRLILYGTWFGLARQDELTKLARVQIDMSNSSDSEWKIDVKKAWAQPPYQVRARLRRIIETIGANSRRVYTNRGTKLTDDRRLPVWVRVKKGNEISYRVNSEHPVVEAFTAPLPSRMKTDFRRVLDLVQSTLPMDSLFSDLGSSPEQLSSQDPADDTLRDWVGKTAKHLRDKGISEKDILEAITLTEPFRSHLQLTKDFLKEFFEDNNSHE